MKTFLIFSFFSIFLEINGISSVKNADFQNKLVNFIHSIISTHFSNDCEFLFVQTNSGENDENNFFFENLTIFPNLTKGGYVVDISTPKFHLNLTNFKNYHKYKAYCFAIFINFPNFKTSSANSSKISTKLFDLLSTKFAPISRKDEDYFFLFSPNFEDFEEIFKMSYISKIKYKILICSEPNGENEIQSHASVFFPFYGEKLGVKIDLNYHFWGNSIPSLNYIFPNFLLDFGGRNLRITAPYRHIFSLEIEKYRGRWRLWRGYYYYGVNEFQRLFNFTYSVMPSTGAGGTGLRFRNGSWIGAVADILYDRADCALIPAQIYERYPHVSYSQRFHVHRIVFTVGLPKPLYTYIIIWPFKAETWALLCVTITLVLMVFLLINRFSIGGGGKWEVSNTLQFAVSSFFEQGLALTKKKNGRVFIFTWLSLLMIISTAYKTKLFELFVFPKEDSPPKNFYELAQRNDYNWGLESAGINSAIHSDLRITTHPVFKKIHDKMTLETNSVDCVLKGIKGNFACIIYYGQMFYVLYRNFTTASRKYPVLVSTEATFTPHTSGFTTEKRAVFLENFNKYLGPLLDNGVIEKWKKMDLEAVRSKRVLWEQETGTLPLFTDAQFSKALQPLTVNMLNGIFMAFMILNILFIFLFIIELMYWKIQLVCTSYRKVLKTNDRKKVSIIEMQEL